MNREKETGTDGQGQRYQDRTTGMGAGTNMGRDRQIRTRT